LFKEVVTPSNPYLAKDSASCHNRHNQIREILLNNIGFNFLSAIMVLALS
jgi:hypothetical protein